MLTIVRKIYNLTKKKTGKTIGTVNNSKNINRNTSIELLRIIAMLMVISLHAINNALLFKDANLSMYNTVLLRFVDTLSQVANGTFLIISGYYMIDRKMNIKKIFCLWGKVLFYSILIYIICTFFLEMKTFPYESFLPILTGQYWFISAYIVLYLLSPILNILANKLNQKQYKYLIVIMVILLGVIRIIFNRAGILSGTMLPVIMVYLLGGYIRKFIQPKKKQYYFVKYVLLAIIFTLVFTILSIVANILPKAYTSIIYFLSAFREYNCIIIVAMTVFIFLKFLTININSKTLNKIITLVSPSVFSIYIIHININLRDYIWVALGAQNHLNTWYFVPYLLGLVLLVFLICLAIDLLRRGIYFLLKKIPVVEKGISKLNGKIGKLNSKLNYIFE